MLIAVTSLIIKWLGLTLNYNHLLMLEVLTPKNY